MKLTTDGFRYRMEVWSESQYLEEKEWRHTDSEKVPKI